SREAGSQQHGASTGRDGSSGGIRRQQDHRQRWRAEVGAVQPLHAAAQQFVKL
ncbi:hypothetical protein AZ044_003885, partial [Pluralibacter gergoviae]